MNASSDSLRRPTGYMRDLEREQGLRQHFQRRVEALELERDAFAYRIQVAQAEIERLKRALPTQAPRQARLGA